MSHISFINMSIYIPHHLTPISIRSLPHIALYEAHSAVVAFYVTIGMLPPLTYKHAVTSVYKRLNAYRIITIYKHAPTHEHISILLINLFMFYQYS